MLIVVVGVLVALPIGGPWLASKIFYSRRAKAICAADEGCDLSRAANS